MNVRKIIILVLDSLQSVSVGFIFYYASTNNTQYAKWTLGIYATLLIITIIISLKKTKEEIYYSKVEEEIRIDKDIKIQEKKQLKIDIETQNEISSQRLEKIKHGELDEFVKFEAYKPSVVKDSE